MPSMLVGNIKFCAQILSRQQKFFPLRIEPPRAPGASTFVAVAPKDRSRDLDPQRRTLEKQQLCLYTTSLCPTQAAPRSRV